MSSTKMEKSRSKTNLVKHDLDEEGDSITGKPCIDFQPDDRWHIKEDHEEQEEHNNIKRRRSGRKRKGSAQRAGKAKKSAPAVNGEINKMEPGENDALHEESSLKNNDSLEESAKDEIQIYEEDGKNDISVLEQDAEDEAASPEKENCLPNDTKEKLNSVTETNGVDTPVSNCTSSEEVKEKEETIEEEKEATEEENKESMEEEKEAIEEEKEAMEEEKEETIEETIEKEKEETVKEGKEEKQQVIEEVKQINPEAIEEVVESSTASDKPAEPEQSKDSALSNENTDSCSAPVLKDERTKDTAADSSKGDASAGEEATKEQSMPELSSNENSQSSFKKDDGDIAIIDEKMSNVNSEGNDSDNEVQIISGGKEEVIADDKLIEQSFTKDKSLSEEERKLSPGYIYFNSLQEKMPEFTAGRYKPVKFPHMGTLMLEENEVIIESPSLLVPLLIKESDRFPKLSEDPADSHSKPKGIRRNFFQSSVGEFLINLGGSRVLESYYKDVRRTKVKQMRKSPNDGKAHEAFAEVQKNISLTKKANAPFTFPLRKCKFCDFKTESDLVLEGHYLIPHITSRREFRCNFCEYLTRDPKEIAFHFEAIHGKKVVSGDQATYYECLFCSFHSHLRSKLKVHMNRCRKYFLPSQNQSPPFDFEFPGVTTKPVTIADVIAHRRMLMGSAKPPYPNQAQSPSADMSNALARKKLASVLSLTGGETFPDSPTLIKHLIGPSSKPGAPGFQLPPNLVLSRPRLRAQQVRPPPPGIQPRYPGMSGSRPRNAPFPGVLTSTASHLASSGISITPVNKQQDPVSARMPAGSQTNMKNITLTPISSAGNLVSQKPGPPQPIALFTNVAGSEISKARAGMLPLSQPNRMQMPPGGRGSRMMAPYQRLNTPPSQVVKTGSGSSFVLCEICDSYIKDLEELRSHMNWVHKVKIHPKMLVSRPPLNCQKCQWRFFTDQGLERHLLGAHGLVTTNMQEMANKNQDGGRCIICGAVFTYKLVSHMTQVHKVTLKPAHLSYKCTVCTATFTLYRLFESHVYNVHSTSAKRPAEESPPTESPPAKKKAPPSPEEPKPELLSAKKCSECSQVVENMEKHIIEHHLKNCRVKLCRIEKCHKCLYSSNEMLVIRMSDFKGLTGSDEDSSEEDDDDEEDESDSSSEGSAENKASESKDSAEEKA